MEENSALLPPPPKPALLLEVGEGAEMPAHCSETMELLKTCHGQLYKVTAFIEHIGAGLNGHPRPGFPGSSIPPPYRPPTHMIANSTNDPRFGLSEEQIMSIGVICNRLQALEVSRDNEAYETDPEKRAETDTDILAVLGQRNEFFEAFYVDRGYWGSMPSVSEYPTCTNCWARRRRADAASQGEVNTCPEAPPTPSPTNTPTEAPTEPPTSGAPTASAPNATGAPTAAPPTTSAEYEEMGDGECQGDGTGGWHVEENNANNMAGTCSTGTMATSEQCLAAAQTLMPSPLPACDNDLEGCQNALQATADSPPGCSVRNVRDWVPTFQANAESSNNGDYSMVCSGGPPAALESSESEATVDGCYGKAMEFAGATIVYFSYNAEHGTCMLYSGTCTGCDGTAGFKTYKIHNPSIPPVDDGSTSTSEPPTPAPEAAVGDNYGAPSAQQD